MASLTSITLEVADPVAARRFTSAAFDLDEQIELRASDAPAAGFRGYSLSLPVAQPSTVDGFNASALDAGGFVWETAVATAAGVVRAREPQ